MKLQKHSANPILKPEPTNAWEELVVCNPGVYRDGNTFYMLYRAAGNDDEHVIRFGLATSEDGVHFERQSNEPVLGPSDHGPDMGCVEDARIVKFDEYFYVTYAFRPFPPGQYWKFKHDQVLTQEHGALAPHFIKRNMANSALAMTKDFKSWIRLGRITDSNLDDRDVILFPEKVNGKFVMLHRPKEWVGENWGGHKYPAIWIRSSDDMLVWNEPSNLLLKGTPNSWEEKVGGSTPPLKTDKGWLVLYHGVETGGTGYYRVGALMLDLNDPTKIIGKTRHWIMEPEFDYEIDGYYKGCVFPTGNVIVDDTLYVYYGGADKYIGLATCNVNELIDFTLSQPF
ncbi:hypothetical protein [Marinoscillum sp. MHG1-6]|uniref:glycoside hydrolase family 130 protein n=1 Tax=Marinoscillum sp. MHG1-6 TaxID=2959627 RepID=UPI0021582DC6|nr:hypothetical protein [Marinoscillum sp. MHG1-6]